MAPLSATLDRTYRPKATAPPQARGPSPTADNGIRGPDTASPELGHTRRRKAASSASSSRAEPDRWRGDQGPGTAPSESARAAAGTQLATPSSRTARSRRRAPRTSHYPRRAPRSGRWGAGGDNDSDLEHGPEARSCPRNRPHLRRKEIEHSSSKSASSSSNLPPMPGSYEDNAASRALADQLCALPWLPSTALANGLPAKFRRVLYLEGNLKWSSTTRCAETTTV